LQSVPSNLLENERTLKIQKKRREKMKKKIEAVAHMLIIAVSAFILCRIIVNDTIIVVSKIIGTLAISAIGILGSITCLISNKYTNEGYTNGRKGLFLARIIELFLLTGLFYSI